MYFSPWKGETERGWIAAGYHVSAPHSLPLLKGEVWCSRLIYNLLVKNVLCVLPLEGMSVCFRWCF